MKKEIQTFAPIFKGFYNSYFIEEIESRIEQDIEEGYLSEDFEYSIDFNKYSKMITEAINQTLFNEFGFEIKFEDLISPEFYNYSNDSINVALKYDSNKFEDLISEHKEELTQMIKDRYTSCDGFISYYSNDLNEWLNDYEECEHKIGALLDMICECEGITEFDILEKVNCDFDLYDIIID